MYNYPPEKCVSFEKVTKYVLVAGKYLGKSDDYLVYSLSYLVFANNKKIQAGWVLKV